jgi:hypothetical protein
MLENDEELAIECSAGFSVSSAGFFGARAYLA